MVLDPAAVYDALVTQDRLRLPELPRTHGIYALYDHAGDMRYIGITPVDPHGFHGRINNRHVTGSEGRSHKFSHAYNTGRMWRNKRDNGADAKVAKDLRSHFARRYCRATIVPVERELHALLPTFEKAVQAKAPAGQLLWLNKRGFDPYDEPVALVDSLLSELAFTSEQHAALGRQQARWSAS
ncbi:MULTISPECIES: hypothetical protein [Roseixanthobacter]|uniref:hypothetical protein n=1 Tax=Xanthobacteraceae TaxID=335928 RepID=UPI003728BC59